jgi:hypothetical protein
MSMERVSRGTPLTLAERAEERAWRLGYRLAGDLLGLTSRGSAMEKIALKLCAVFGNGHARHSWHTSVCSCCHQVTCPRDCIEAIASRRMQVWNVSKGDDVQVYACSACMRWNHECRCGRPLA